MENTKTQSTLRELLDSSCQRYPSNVVSSFVDGSHAFTFADFHKKVGVISEELSRNGIGATERVLILSENCPQWSVAMFAATAYGRVMVPVLPDCSANEITNIIKHSQARAAFVSARQMGKISQELMDSMDVVYDMESLTAMKTTPKTERAATAVPSAGDLAAILYTSGTSGNAKGVMLSHGNLMHNLVCAPDVYRATEQDIWLSFLPMAHTYEFSLGLLYPFSSGARVYYLDKAPTPSVLIKAFNTVHPTLICSVPLIIEKIYRKSVLATIGRSRSVSFLYRVFPTLVCRIIGKTLLRTFGGNLKVFAIGGAKLDSEVETFLSRARFPYAIGYGLTETAPLVCAAPVGKTKVGSTGHALTGVQIRLEDINPETDLGEICVKGPNVMMGYYKDPERTAEAFTADGWFRTKDLACMDQSGRVFITGRLGNMILGASGENIYPEEIEMVINGIDDVEESIVKSVNGRLVALIKMSDSVLNWADEGKEEFSRHHEMLKASILRKVNKAVNKSSQIASIEFVKENFEKTATRKIRRFKYV